MTIEELEILLERYGWVLESQSPLEVRSNDGEHHATNFAAEVLLEYLVMLDSSDNEEEKESMIERFKVEKIDSKPTESKEEPRPDIDFQDGQHY